MATDNSLGDCWQMSVGKGIEGTIRKYFWNSKYIWGHFHFQGLPRKRGLCLLPGRSPLLSGNTARSARSGSRCTPIQYWHRSQNQRMVASSKMAVSERTLRQKLLGEEQTKVWHWKKRAQVWVIRFKTLKSLPFYIHCLGKVPWG